MMSRRQSIYDFYDFYDDKHCDEKQKIEMNCRINIFALRTFVNVISLLFTR